MAKITVLGSGGFGTGLALMADRQGHEVTVWSAHESSVNQIRKDKENKKYLPGVTLPESVLFATDMNVARDADILIYALPSFTVRTIVRSFKPYLHEKTIVVNASKGLEDGSLKRLSMVIQEELPGNPVVILSGPSHAEEVAVGMPTTVVASSMDMQYAYTIQELLSDTFLRVYANDDLIGCELGGALKNIIALCAGICDGMGYGDNTKAALMTRGITEIARLGVALGARMDTFAGLTGIGDLIVTCTSMHSRNRRAGILIGQGVLPQEAVARVGTVEGYACAKVAYKLCQKAKVDMPITEQLNNILFNNINVKDALSNLMGRPQKHETESIWTAKL